MYMTSGKRARQRAETFLRSVAEDRRSLDLRDWPAPLVGRLIEGGVGPVLWRLTRDAPPALAIELQSAELTARLVIGGLIEATEEILRAAGAGAQEIILLKGIATANAHYPEPHLRVMGDIDLLAPPHLYESLQSLLLQLGYRQTSELPEKFFTTHHHAMPFYHPMKHLWIEVHHSLFAPASRLAREACFTPAAIFANSIPYAFRGIPARRLDEELHLIYVCSHWGNTLNLERGLLPLLDVLYLLRANAFLDWDRVQQRAGRGPARRYLSLVLGYLLSRDLIELPAEVRRWIDKNNKDTGGISVRLLGTLIDHFLVLRRPVGRLYTEANLSTIWDTLLQGGPAYANLLRVPLTLLFPPHRQDRFRPLLIARRAWSLFRGRSNH